MNTNSGAKTGKNPFALIMTLIFSGIIIMFFINHIKASQNVPEFTKDKAEILSEEQEEYIKDYHQRLLSDYDIDYRVLSVNGTEDINIFANEQFKTMNVGEYSSSGRGLLIVIDTEQNLVRLEVSAALEGVFTDAFIAYIQQRQMVHFFRTNRISDGIIAATELIFTRAQEAVKGEEFFPPMETFSSGAGAETKAHIGDGADDFFRNRQLKTESGQGLSPVEVVKAYHKAMDNRDGRPNLPIYSEGTVKMLRNWTVTPAQMDSVASEATQCHIDKTDVSGIYAVVRYNVKERECAPYFLIKEDGEWKLNLTMMQKAIRFNYNNLWHFDLNNPSAMQPYKFAFTDWRLDKHGYPHQTR